MHERFVRRNHAAALTAGCILVTTAGLMAGDGHAASLPPEPSSTASVEPWRATPSTLGARSADDADAAASAPLAAPPAGWTTIRSTVVGDADRTSIGKQLGVELTYLDNIIYRLPDGRQIQVNTIRTGHEADAETLAATIGRQKPRLVQRTGNAVIELVGQDRIAIEYARRHWGFHAPAQKWTIAFDAVPIESVDEDALNPLANAMVAGASRDRIETLAATVISGNTLRLAGTSGGRAVRWEITPTGEAASHAGGEIVDINVARAPRDRGLPRVSLRAELTTGPPRPPSARTDFSALLVATDDWPSDEPGIRAEARRIAGPPEHPDLERAMNLLQWCSGTFTYGGDRLGSRVGVIRTLITRTGRCWDLSDVFFTFARAAGLPARQVAGWLAGDEGHVWCEVLIDGVWTAIDPTAPPSLGVDQRYLGYVISEDGRFPFVYASWPQISPLGASRQESPLESPQETPPPHAPAPPPP
ncbi:MAG: transglutaminase family protein [Phycisphaerales bacterium]